MFIVCDMWLSDGDTCFNGYDYSISNTDDSDSDRSSGNVDYCMIFRP